MAAWDNTWEKLIPFLDYHVEIRTVLCSTSATESLNARYRRAAKARARSKDPVQDRPPLAEGARLVFADLLEDLTRAGGH